MKNLHIFLLSCITLFVFNTTHCPPGRPFTLNGPRIGSHRLEQNRAFKAGRANLMDQQNRCFQAANRLQNKLQKKKLSTSLLPQRELVEETAEGKKIRMNSLSQLLSESNPNPGNLTIKEIATEVIQATQDHDLDRGDAIRFVLMANNMTNWNTVHKVLAQIDLKIIDQKAKQPKRRRIRKGKGKKKKKK